MRIQLTDEQISQIIKGESELLQQKFNADKLKLEKKLESDIRELARKLESDISKLSGKYKYLTIENPGQVKQRTKIDNEVLRQMVADKKSVAEIASHFNSTVNSIRNKLSVMKIKITENQ
jgi:hypothetical protein